jgi:SAM-dependent methyltransferase
LAAVGATLVSKIRPHISFRPTFTLDDRTFPYSYDVRAAASERTVEVPLAEQMMSDARGRVLEIGNVMRQFITRPPRLYTVVDKYEMSDEIRNEDVLDVVGEFDLIVSISTMEHVGLDEFPRDVHKAERGVKHLTRLVAGGGRMLITWPLGFNHHLDDALRDGAIAPDRASYLRRISQWSNKWEQVDAEAAYACRYGWPYPGGNAIAVLRWGARSF